VGARWREGGKEDPRAAACPAEAVRGEKLPRSDCSPRHAHELNNPLTGILTFSHLIPRRCRTEARTRDLDLVIGKPSGGAIIRRLWISPARKTPEKKFADLNGSSKTRRASSTARASARHRDHHGLDRELRGMGRRGPDQQVVMNMLVNAQHAIEEKGSITVSSRRCRAEAPGTGRGTGAMVKSRYRFRLRNPEKNLDRIFDPFFTSKEVGKGTGLGCRQVRYHKAQAVRSSGGVRWLGSPSGLLP